MSSTGHQKKKKNWTILNIQILRNFENTLNNKPFLEFDSNNEISLMYFSDLDENRKKICLIFLKQLC